MERTPEKPENCLGACSTWNEEESLHFVKMAFSFRRTFYIALIEILRTYFFSFPKSKEMSPLLHLRDAYFTLSATLINFMFFGILEVSYGIAQEIEDGVCRFQIYL